MVVLLVSKSARGMPGHVPLGAISSESWGEHDRCVDLCNVAAARIVSPFVAWWIQVGTVRRWTVPMR